MLFPYYEKGGEEFCLIEDLRGSLGLEDFPQTFNKTVNDTPIPTLLRLFTFPAMEDKMYKGYHSLNARVNESLAAEFIKVVDKKPLPVIQEVFKINPQTDDHWITLTFLVKIPLDHTFQLMLDIVESKKEEIRGFREEDSSYPHCKECFFSSLDPSLALHLVALCGDCEENEKEIAHNSLRLFIKRRLLTTAQLLFPRNHQEVLNLILTLEPNDQIIELMKEIVVHCYSISDNNIFNKGINYLHEHELHKEACDLDILNLFFGRVRRGN